MSEPLTALILHLQRLSTEDGPGIRTSIFFKGCPLHCVWCHNPESIAPYPQVHWVETRCIGCEICLATCPNGALTKSPDGLILVNRERCQGCGACAAACPGNAMELLGEEITLSALIEELMKDEAYFKTSGGGVTATGGEPTLHAEFVAALFEALQARGIHTALDTCGVCSHKSLQRIMPHTDLVLFDIKLMDDQAHHQATGQDNRRILENLVSIADEIRREKRATRLWIRTPLIPEFTDSQENLSAISDFLHENLEDVVERWELCAFNNLCRDKYRRLGLTWHFETTPLMTQAALDQCEAYAKLGNFNSDKIWVTGAAQTEPTR